MTDKRKQVSEQCGVVAYLANRIAEVHIQKGRMIADHGSTDAFPDSLIEFMGENTAHLMVVLSAVLYDMDALDKNEDTWVEPIFRKAERLWPYATHS